MLLQSQDDTVGDDCSQDHVLKGSVRVKEKLHKHAHISFDRTAFTSTGFDFMKKTVTKNPNCAVKHECLIPDLHGLRQTFRSHKRAWRVRSIKPRLWSFCPQTHDGFVILWIKLYPDPYRRKNVPNRFNGWNILSVLTETQQLEREQVAHEHNTNHPIRCLDKKNFNQRHIRIKDWILCFPSFQGFFFLLSKKVIRKFSLAQGGTDVMITTSLD